MRGTYRVTMTGADGRVCCPVAVVTVTADTLTWGGCGAGTAPRPARRDVGAGRIYLGTMYGYGVPTVYSFRQLYRFEKFARQGSATFRAEWVGPCREPGAADGICEIESGSSVWTRE